MIIIVIVVRSDDNNHHGSRWEGKVSASGDNIPHQGPDHLHVNQLLWSSFSSSLVLGSKLGELSWDQKTSSWVTLLPTNLPTWLQMTAMVIIMITMTMMVILVMIIMISIGEYWNYDCDVFGEDDYVVRLVLSVLSFLDCLVLPDWPQD